MIIIPAIDLKDGACVRLLEGRAETAKVYDDDPVRRAESFADAGAKRIHVVDLDGAFEGRPKNHDAVRAIAGAMQKRGVEVEVGGGLRDLEKIGRVLEVGASFAIAGTMAVKDPALFEAACKKFPGRVIAGIDAKAGLAATEGWVDASTRLAVDLARETEAKGAAAIIYTDIARDGTGLGVNVAETERVASWVAIPVIASGGIKTIEDVLALKSTRVAGVIVGRAIYEGTLDLAAALRAC